MADTGVEYLAAASAPDEWDRLGITMVLFLGAVIALNVWDAQQEVGATVITDNVALLAVAGLVVAAPMLGAAVVIDRLERG